MGAFPINGSKHLYTNKIESNFDIVNTGMTVTKNIKIFDYKLPVSCYCDVESANKIQDPN
jgi:hypothetical protein